MTDCLISQALARQIECPEIHKKAIKLKRGDKNPFVEAMVLDLKENIPGLSVRQISSLVGMSKTRVSYFLDSGEKQEEWTADDNESSAAAELAALREHHPGRQYEDAPEAADEPTGPVLFTAPPFRDAYHRADQSHTIKRPITLATTPYRVAA